MGLYIKGVKVPKFGDCIVITSDGIAYKYRAGDVVFFFDAKPIETSIIELPPHGRLIDADALFRTMNEVGWYSNADRDEVALELVLDAKTIITASGGADNG